MHSYLGDCTTMVRSGINVGLVVVHQEHRDAVALATHVHTHSRLTDETSAICCRDTQVVNGCSLAQ